MEQLIKRKTHKQAVLELSYSTYTLRWSISYSDYGALIYEYSFKDKKLAEIAYKVIQKLYMSGANASVID